MPSPDILSLTGAETCFHGSARSINTSGKSFVDRLRFKDQAEEDIFVEQNNNNSHLEEKDWKVPRATRTEVVAGNIHVKANHIVYAAQDDCLPIVDFHLR